MYVRTSSYTIRQMSVCMSGRAAGSVLEEAQYNQAYELMNELHTIQQDRYIKCSQKRGVHTCTSYEAKKVLCYKMIHVSLLRLTRKLNSAPAFALSEDLQYVVCVFRRNLGCPAKRTLPLTSSELLRYGMSVLRESLRLFA